MCLRAVCGKPAEFSVSCGETEVCVEGADVQRAERVPMSRDRLEKQMKKTGNTPFVFEQLDIQMDEDIFLPVQALNELRRSGVGDAGSKTSGIRKKRRTGAVSHLLRHRKH